ncbi:MAG: alanine racemase, partial [Desulfitobacteriaceae bacterium]|nr:alanine racemase [Desulfitobacteriaceae bacterium]
MGESEFTRWIEINLDAIVHNFREVRRLVTPTVKIMAVVKSDAYGHGAVEVARVLEETGADMLAVTTVEEGRELVQN